MVTHSHGFQLEIRNELSGRYRRLVYKCWSRDNTISGGEITGQSNTRTDLSPCHSSTLSSIATSTQGVDKQLVAALGKERTVWGQGEMHLGR
ncbi:unnamed protein product [Arabis nemorensis]|uniref:Uncharacterized protein n=1 Tax=Arabis nemorensis TaxID=586526 RepID=A0A565CTZ5_9BRAS|nr:unnamed protein product [Arabis nemorensis]